MNQPNQPFNEGRPYAPQRVQAIWIILDRKMYYQQVIISMFGRERLHVTNMSDQSFILPLIHHNVSLDVWTYVLIWVDGFRSSNVVNWKKKVSESKVDSFFVWISLFKSYGKYLFPYFYW